MHELSLTRSIVAIVTRAAKGRKVAVVEVDVGALRQVVPGTLRRCWGLVTPGTWLEGSRLEVRHVPAVIECTDCGRATSLTDAPVMRCATCGCRDVRIVSGEEFSVTALQLEV